MVFRVAWLLTGFTALSVVNAVVALPGAPLQTARRSGQQSSSASVGAVSRSLIASWQAHGAADSVIENAPLSGRPLPPPPIDGQDWILDLLVLWHWRGDMPEMRQGSVGDDTGGVRNVHRITVGDRELRLEFDRQAGTARVVNGPLVELKGANVLMLEVGEHDVTVSGTATVNPRYSSYPVPDPIATVVSRSAKVAEFVAGAQ
jgi:hypothetical protein